MSFFVLLWVLGGAPKLSPPVSSQQKDGSWKCSAFCLTSGNDDAGFCRVPLVSRAPTKDACEADLVKTCAKTKPPKGGCR